jgi:hypothetical protein
MEAQVQSKTTSPITSKPYQILLFLSLFLYSLYALGMLQHSLRLIGYPFAVDYVEWPEISRSVQLLENQPIYDSWDQLPLRVANYPPLFTFVHAIGIWLTSPTPLIGRLIALCCTLGIMTLIGGILQNHIRVKGMWLVIPVFSGVFYATSHMTWLWSSIVRVDNLAILLSLGAIYLYTRTPATATQEEFSTTSQLSHAQKHVALVLCGLALFTKQTMLAAPLAILIHTALVEREHLKIRLLYFGGTVGILYGSLMIFTGGLAYNHLVVANINPFDWDMLRAFWRDFWMLYHWTLPLLILGVFVLRQHVVLLLYAVFATIFSLSIAKVGSSLNYVLELWAVVCIFGGAALLFPLQRKQSTTSNVVSSFLLVVVLLYGWQNVFHVPWERQRVSNQKMRAMALGMWNDVATYSTYLPFHHLNPYAKSQVDIIKRNVKLYVPTPAQWELDMMFDIEDYIQQKATQPILSEDMNFYRISEGQDIKIQSFEMRQLAIQGIFDEEIIHKCLRTKDCLPTLVLMFDSRVANINYVSRQRFGKKTIEIINENYQPSAQLGPYYIYTVK